jgi:hypothetical protein
VAAVARSANSIAADAKPAIMWRRVGPSGEALDKERSSQQLM